MPFKQFDLFWDTCRPIRASDWEDHPLACDYLVPYERFNNGSCYRGRMPDMAMNTMSCCFFDMVARLMEPIPAPFTQLNIIITTVPGAEPRVGSAIEGIRDLFLPYDPWPFFELDESGKMEMLADITLRALDVLQGATGLDCDPARKAVALARAAGFRNVWVPLRKRSKSGLTAEVEVEHDTRGITVWMSVFNRRGQLLRRVPVLWRWPDSWALKRDYLKNLSWEGDTVILSSEVSQFSFSLDVVTGAKGFVRTSFEQSAIERGTYRRDMSKVPPQARFLLQSEVVPEEAHEPAVRADVTRRDYGSGRAMKVREGLAE